MLDTRDKSQEYAIRWSVVSKNCRRELRLCMQEGTLKIDPDAKKILRYTMLEHSDVAISNYLKLNVEEVKRERCEALLEILNICKKVVIQYPEMTEGLDCINEKINLIESYLATYRDRHIARNGLLSVELDWHIQSPTIGRIIGYFFEAESEILVADDTFLTLEQLSKETRYSISQLGHLLRTGAIAGEKVVGRWRSSIEEIEKYQRKQNNLGAPRKPRKY